MKRKEKKSKLHEVTTELQSVFVMLFFILFIGHFRMQF